MHNNQANTFSSKLSSAGRNVFWLFLWLAGISFSLWYPLRWLFGDALKPVRAASYVTPWLLAFVLLMSIVAGLTRRKRLSFALAIPALAIGSTFAPLFLSNYQATPPPDSFFLTVMSYNLHDIRAEEARTSLVKIMRQEKPDILLIQEIDPDKVWPFLKDALADIYPELFMVADQAGFHQIILSRYPVKLYSAEFDKGRTLKALVETQVGAIEIWNAHPIPPFLIPPEQYDEQISALVSDVAATRVPLIVGGDFNATDQSEAYRSINRYLKNAHWEAGVGFGFTYPAPPYTFMDTHIQTGPLWRIDHIFYSQDFIATSARTLDIAGGSDHFPVMAELSLAK